MKKKKLFQAYGQTRSHKEPIEKQSRADRSNFQHLLDIAELNKKTEAFSNVCTCLAIQPSPIIMKKSSSKKMLITNSIYRFCKVYSILAISLQLDLVSLI